MANPSKRKGDTFEREIVAKFQAQGLHAIRMPYSGALNNWKGDIEAPVQNKRMKFEAKRRRSGFKTIYGWLGSNYGLIVRDDKTEPLIVLRFDDFLSLARLNP